MKPLRLASLFRVLAFVVGMNALAAGQKLQVKFGAPTIYETGANDVVSIAVADLNGDGNLDIVVANECNNNFCENGTVSVLLGNGDGTFQPAATYSTGATTNGVATLSTSFAKEKTYTVKASYPGDAFRKASSGTVKQVVNP